MASKLTLVSYNYREAMARILGWSYKVPPMSLLARRATIVDVIREMRREASLGVIRVLEEAEKLGIRGSVAEDLADKVMLYELTPEEALARLRRLAGRRGKGRTT